ncbi:MAG: hypothetical protein RR370_03230 [Synergistaceae bacterium]
MKIQILKRNGREYDCMICRHNETGKFSYVNLTLSRICPCEFDTIEEALDDLNSESDVRAYTIMGEEPSSHILIDISPNITGVAGHDYGKYVFEEQVKPYLKYRTKYTIHFPEHITLLAISFVEGFSEDFVRADFIDRFIIQGNPKFVKRFNADLVF